MVEGIERYLNRLTRQTLSRPPEPGDPAVFRRLIGANSPRLPFALTMDRTVGLSPTYTIETVHWPVLPGVEAEGLRLAPRIGAAARIIAIPDADQTPEFVAGTYGHRLAAAGAEVLIPTIIDRADTFSGNPALRYTNQPHREWIYRMSFEMGRHIIGYEVQKILAAVHPSLPTGVIGYGEGGLLALYSSALEPRIAATLTGGYFDEEKDLAEQPIYRNVWSLYNGFRDKDLAAMIGPGKLIVDNSGYPIVPGPPPARDTRRGAAPGSLIQGRSTQPPSSPEPIGAFASALHLTLQASGAPAPHLTAPTDRMERQVGQLVDYAQTLVHHSGRLRRDRWTTLTAEEHRRYFHDEVLGRLADPVESGDVETRVIYDKPEYTGYEVYLPVANEVFAYGILLVPKNIKGSERRPVVVCQHGLEDRPQDTIEPRDVKREATYHRFAARLAERGYVVYAPQNPYIGGTRFRQLLRKGHPLKLSLFSFIVAQHERTTGWLASLPFVDPDRIGFYGLSYGGKTAMRVPPLNPRYKVVICSGDFNEWIWKTTSIDEPFSYMFTGEYDMLEWNLGSTYNYSDLAALIAPRPFMVERGHDDPVGIDEWIAYEYAKVRRLYASLDLAPRTAIEFFKGPHTINGVRSFEFLDRYLKPAATLGR